MSTEKTLVSELQMLLEFDFEGTDKVTICERSPISLSKVYLRKKDLDPLRYNLYKQILDRGKLWKPNLIYYLERPHDNPEEQVEAHYLYVLKHLKGTEVVYLPCKSAQQTARDIREDIECRLAKNADPPTSETCPREPCVVAAGL